MRQQERCEVIRGELQLQSVLGCPSLPRDDTGVVEQHVDAGLPVDDAQRFAEFLLTDFVRDGETVMVAPADGYYATPGLGTKARCRASTGIPAADKRVPRIAMFLESLCFISVSLRAVMVRVLVDDPQTA